MHRGQHTADKRSHFQAELGMHQESCHMMGCATHSPCLPHNRRFSLRMRVYTALPARPRASCVLPCTDKPRTCSSLCAGHLPGLGPGDPQHKDTSRGRDECMHESGTHRVEHTHLCACERQSGTHACVHVSGRVEQTLVCMQAAEWNTDLCADECA